MNKPEYHPPGWLIRLFRWFCHPDYAEDIEGDLRERYFQHAQLYGLGKANIIFAWEILRLFRPGLLRPFFRFHSVIHISMFKHNIVITYRSFIRNKGSFLTNLVGLSTGLACTIFIYLWVIHELSVDTFHEHDHRLYQILEHVTVNDEIRTSYATSAPVPEALKQEMPEIAFTSAVAPSHWPGFNKYMITHHDKNIRASVQYVGKDYFQMFSFPLLFGRADQVLGDKSSVVISQELAKKLFEKAEDAMGKEIKVQHQRTYIISGVFQTIPSNSSIQFDLALSFESLKDEMPWVKEWHNSGPRGYVMLKEGTDLGSFNQKIAGFISEKSGQESRIPFLKPFSSKYLYGNFKDGQQVGGRISYVKFFSLIALFILFIACINFMNLSTARASKRLKEMGIKKVLGSRRKELIIQHLGEAFFIVILSLAVALVMVHFLMPIFNAITGKHLSLSFDLMLIQGLIGITIFTSLLSGSYPALFLSKLSPMHIFRNNWKVSQGERRIRRGLVVFQFVITMLFMVGVSVVYQQMQLINSQSLGYDKNQVIYIDAEGTLTDDKEPFFQALSNIPGIINASSTTHNLTGQSWSTSSVEWEGKHPDEQIEFEMAGTYYSFIETMGMSMIQGRSFSREFGDESGKIIINEEALRKMRLQNPIGKKITIGEEEKEIIGVVKNFHFESLHYPLKPLICVFMPDGGNFITIKLDAKRELEAIDDLRHLYQQLNPGFPFQYHFLDEQYRAQYEAEQRVAVLSTYFTALAIIISCLGLFGLITFTMERRMKEISIRKVLGSSTTGIIALLSSEFTILVGIAITIAFPLSYVLSHLWLDHFSYKIDLQWWLFIGAGAISLLIAWITIGIKLFNIGYINPIHHLKDE